MSDIGMFHDIAFINYVSHALKFVVTKFWNKITWIMWWNTLSCKI